MAYPEPTEVAPWYLRNINQALALDSATGNVYLRTNSAIIGNVSVGNVAIGSLGNVDLSYNYLLTSVVGNVTALQGTNPWNITGNANVVVSSGNVGVVGNVNVTQGTIPWSVSGNVISTIASGNVTVANDPAQITAFAEPLAITITPVLQNLGSYGLDPSEWVTTQLNNGNVVVDDHSTWLVQSGTSAGGYARLATNRYVTYKPGQGAMFRWTAAFTTVSGNTRSTALGVDNIVQNTGPIDQEDGYSVGFTGSTDGSSSNKRKKIAFTHRRAGRVEIQQLTVTTAPTGTQTATITLNGQTFNITLTSSTSTAYTAQQIAALLKADAVCGNTWNIQACDSIVTFTYYSPGAKSGTYSFSSTGAGTIAVAAFSQLVAGSAPEDTVVYQDEWDNQTVQFDPAKLNVYGIDFRWLGAGIVRLFMEDPATGQMTLMHTQKYASTATVPHLDKPSLRMAYRSGTTNPAVTPSQNVIVRGASCMGAIQGTIVQTNPSQSWFNIDTNARAKDTIWHLMSIQNPIIRGSDVNKRALVIQDLSVSSQSNDPSVIYVVVNAVGTSSYLLFQPLPYSTQFNFAQYATNLVTENLSLDAVSIVQSLGINGSAQFNLLPYNLAIAPGQSISVFISSGSQINRTSIGMTWRAE